MPATTESGPVRIRPTRGQTSWTKPRNSHPRWTRPRGPDTPDNQIPAANGYSYDKAGNLTAAPGTVNLSYNGSDQLTGRSGSATGSYTYAGTDQTELVSQVVPGNATWSYAYGRTDQHGLPILDTLTNPNGTSYLTHDDRGTPLAIKTWQGAISYYVLDGLGSPVALVNGQGSVIATYAYDPWGNVTVGNPTNSTAANLQPYRFAGGMLDRSTNYVKFGMRYYDPGSGRFTQQDSVEVLGDPGRGNRYQYAGDNPVNSIDPSGRMSCNGFLDCAGAFLDQVGSTASAYAIGAGATAFFGTCAAGVIATAGAGCLVGAPEAGATAFIGGLIVGAIVGTYQFFTS